MADYEDDYEEEEEDEEVDKRSYKSSRSKPQTTLRQSRSDSLKKGLGNLVSGREKKYDAEGYDDSDVDFDFEGYDDSDENVQNLFVGDRRFEVGKVNMAAFWTLAILSILLSNAPGVSTVLYPINQFVIMVHESCHALASLLTGGQPSMTIVDDGMGHAGLTQMNGGIVFITVQAGYLGTAVFGCFLIFLGQFHKYSRYVLMAIGSTIIISSLIFITPAIFSFTTWWSGLLSMGWGLAMGAACIIIGFALKPIWANLVLLFLAVQTALSSMTLVWFLLPHSLGLAGKGFSDATVMQDHFFIPAPFWAVWWILLSIGMLMLTLRFTYGRSVVKNIVVRKKRTTIESHDDDEDEESD